MYWDLRVVVARRGIYAAGLEEADKIRVALPMMSAHEKSAPKSNNVLTTWMCPFSAAFKIGLSPFLISCCDIRL